MIGICLLIGRIKPESKIPLVVASNRDEQYDRASEPTRVRNGDGDEFTSVAPRDQVGGGTWIGINQQGLFSALTNPLAPDQTYERSRGELVQRLLKNTDNFSEIREELAPVNPGMYGPFSLIVVLPEGILSIRNRPGEGFEWEEYGEGEFILSSQKGLEFVESGMWEQFPWLGSSRREDPEKLRARLQEFCKRTGSFRHRDAVCRKGDTIGTVSSSILMVMPDASRFEFDFTAGAPCTTPYRSVSIPPELEQSLLQRWSL